MSRKEFKLGFLQSEKSKMTLLSQRSGNAANKNNTDFLKIILQSYIYIQLREKAEGRMCGKEGSQKAGVASLNLPHHPSELARPGCTGQLSRARTQPSQAQGSSLYLLLSLTREASEWM